MAGVDNVYQYSVEVKSRFSLFMNDELNNEDPDILISKLQNERIAKNKKEKSSTVHPATEEAKKSEPNKDAENKTEHSAVKAKPVRMPRLPKNAQPAAPGVAPGETEHGDSTMKENEEAHAPAMRSRGGPRGFSRGYRGGRGQGPRAQQNGGTEGTSDPSIPRDSTFDFRGRGRGRPRGFGRGRGFMYADYREFDRQPGAERMNTKPVHKQDGFTAGNRPYGGEANENPVAENDNDQADATSENVVENGNKENKPDAEVEPIVEEEPKHYTLQEYRAMQSSAKPTISLSTKGSRKANDGKDVFANMVVAHQKLDEVSDEEVEEVEKEPEEQQAFNINVSFTDSFVERSRGRGFGNRGFDRGRGFRGGRGMVERGWRGRGGSRGEFRGRGFGRGMPTEHQAAPAIHSDQDFPSLK